MPLGPDHWSLCILGNSLMNNIGDKITMCSTSDILKPEHCDIIMLMLVWGPTLYVRHVTCGVRLKHQRGSITRASISDQESTPKEEELANA